MTAREQYLASKRARRPAYVRQLEIELERTKAERDQYLEGLKALQAYARLPKFADALTPEEERYHHPYIHRDDVLMRIQEAL